MQAACNVTQIRPIRVLQSLCGTILIRNFEEGAPTIAWGNHHLLFIIPEI